RFSRTQTGPQEGCATWGTARRRICRSMPDSRLTAIGKTSQTPKVCRSGRFVRADTAEEDPPPLRGGRGCPTGSGQVFEAPPNSPTDDYGRRHGRPDSLCAYAVRSRTGNTISGSTLRLAVTQALRVAVGPGGAVAGGRRRPGTGRTDSAGRIPRLRRAWRAWRGDFAAPASVSHGTASGAAVSGGDVRVRSS